MANPHISPISQLLNTLGITREDLHQRSDQMRQFLTAESATSSRVPSNQPTSSAPTSRSLSRASSSTAPFTRQLSRANSISAHDASPAPATTSVKPEPEDESLPPPPLPARQFDSMEMVLERQRMNRKQKRSKKRDQDLPTWTTLPQPESPSPGAASPSVTRQPFATDSRDDARETRLTSPISTVQPPVTPLRSKYYREHTSYIGPDAPVPKAESPSPAPIPARASVPTYPYPYYYPSAYTTQSRFLSLPFRSAQAGSTTRPRTPVKASRHQHGRRSSPVPATSPLPPSSPPDASSPFSSPAHRLVNIVSSPGPMDELADERKPPYTLPPGPYSTERPLSSYAALIGQAILSSRDHRLTLQEIYEWIVIVYPHFKRGERTWMNSIRHVLSTTVHFRKVSRERSAGRSHWAIFDEDLECFANGGFRKPGASVKRGAGVARSRPKKRPAEEVEEETSPSALAKSAKRVKQTLTPPLPSLPTGPSSARPPFLLPALVHPQGKPKPQIGPTSHHQTYYESCVAAPAFVPSEIIFPPLPKSSYRIIAANPSSSPAARAGDEDNHGVESEDEFCNAEPSPPPASTCTPGMASRLTHPSSSSSASVPALTPNHSSSSPIPSSELEMSHYNSAVPVAGTDDADSASIIDGEERACGGSLRPVQFWDESSPSGPRGKALQPGIELQEYVNQDDEDDEEEDVPLMIISQTNKLMKQKIAKVKARPLVKMATSPTLHRRKTATAARTGNKTGKRKKAKHTKAPLVAAPSTPPRNNTRRKSQLSPVYTPLSHKAMYMSPSTSLGYKSHLDPGLLYGAAKRLSVRSQDDEYEDDEPSDLMRTPSRKRNAASSSAHPMTPKRLLFPSDSSSPFRTPGGGTLSVSPFRTPGGGRGGIFDPHDPSTLLDEELSSLGAAGRDSPAGLYGKGSLYDSPNALDGSPGKWARWW
ncbi:hypothetical protein B0H15DRAFT_861154 [Mycena belliarum]|uniref:Fork-head domain-containing protein n=1 Tax=Mycena belliarum TaxID=1033014 RepID=A0AAD6TU64_9AGAR|nr:hypothetical protein B0H15DRAFT_861154 [Mycena belliae]